MIEKIFKSEISHDIILISHNVNSFGCEFAIKQFDEIIENIKLLNSIMEYLHCNNIKWVNVDIDKYIAPQNCYCFRNKMTGLLRCHVEDFEQFYFSNMSNIIKPKHVHIKATESDQEDGWTTIVDHKKNMKDKYKKINQLKNTMFQ